MRISNEMAVSMGLVVGNPAGTALVNPVFGFSGRRVYINGGTELIAGPCIHLSGFTLAECQELGAVPNPKDDFSARVTGFLPLTPENLGRACRVVREATSPAYEPPRKLRRGVTLAGLFAAASKV